jgi:hypothetical protein
VVEDQQKERRERQTDRQTESALAYVLFAVGAGEVLGWPLEAERVAEASARVSTIPSSPPPPTWGER